MRCSTVPLGRVYRLLNLNFTLMEAELEMELGRFVPFGAELVAGGAMLGLSPAPWCILLNAVRTLVRLIMIRMQLKSLGSCDPLCTSFSTEGVS